MKTQISDAVARVILTRLPGTRGCTRADLTTDAGPAGVIHFLNRSLERRAQLEVAERFSGDFGWFDVAQPSVQGAIQHLQQEVARAARFPATEWERAVQHASVMTLDYLLNPVDTMVGFAFPDGASDIAAADLRRRASYFSEYSYMGTAVTAYVTRKGDRRMARSELSNTLRHVMRQLTAEYTGDDWMRQLQPLIHLVAFASDRFQGGLPVAFADAFFTSHGQPALASAVVSAARAAKADMISTGTLASIVGDGAEAKAEPEPPSTDEPQPLWKQFKQDAAAPASPEMPPIPDAQPLWKSFQDRLDTDRQGVTFQDMESEVLGTLARDREAHVRRLFADDALAYADVIRRLYHAADWSAASGILASDVFRRFAVDIYSDEAVAFTNAVESRFT